MPYIEEICEAGDIIEVSKYYAYRAHAKGEKREKRGNPTTEAQKRVNQRKAEKELRLLMAANFENGDALVRLDFAKKPGGSVEMQDLISKAVKKIRKEYAKEGKILRSVYTKEVGPKGGRHIHMLMNREGMDVLEVLTKCWTHGYIHIDPVTTAPDFSKIAAYFIKYAAKTEETEGKLIGKRWYPSRSLKKPKVTKEIIKSNRFRENIKKEPGYVLKKDSVRSGVSEYTGYQYFTYTLVRLGKQESREDREARRDHEKADKYSQRRGKGAQKARKEEEAGQNPGKADKYS